MARTGFYPGSFDPITYGHLDIIGRAARMFDKLVVALGHNHDKAGLLDVEERLRVMEEALRPLRERTGCDISLARYSCLTVDAARRAGATVIVRGLRDGSDFDYEVRMAQMNASLDDDMETIFLAAAPSSRMISSSLIRQVASMGGDITRFVPAEAAEAVRAALARRQGRNNRKHPGKDKQ